MCLCKIGVWWHWITQFSVCVFRLPGPRNWEHLPVHIWRGSGGAWDHPHVVSFQWPPPPTPTHFLSVAEVAFSMAKSNIVKPALFTQDIVQPDIFRKTCCAVSSPFYFSWKGAELRCLRRWLKQLYQKCFWSLIDLLNSYLMVSSVVGFYSLRGFKVLTPRKDDTTMTTVKMGWEDRVRGEVGARVLRLLLRCWCVWDPLCFIYFLSSLLPSSLVRTPTAH